MQEHSNSTRNRRYAQGKRLFLLGRTGMNEGKEEKLIPLTFENSIEKKKVIHCQVPSCNQSHIFHGTATVPSQYNFSLFFFIRNNWLSSFDSRSSRRDTHVWNERANHTLFEGCNGTSKYHISPVIRYCLPVVYLRARGFLSKGKEK